MTAMHFSTTGRHAHGHSLGDRLSSAAHRVNATIGQWHRRIRDRRELARLDDRMLKDIGVTRATAVTLASKPFWKE